MELRNDTQRNQDCQGLQPNPSSGVGGSVRADCESLRDFPRGNRRSSKAQGPGRGLRHDAIGASGSTSSELPPLYISQRSSERVGLTSRQFRDAVNRYGIRHSRVGKLVLVKVEDWHLAMAKLASTGQSEPANDVPAPMTADSFLARLGRKRCGT